MSSASSGSIPIFRVAGIQVYLHWLWLIWGYFQVVSRQGARPIGWSIAEYLALFLIVLLHEFGHALACRQTGGEAKEIVLWPLGGIAFVKPPLRATAQLWSIVAGPLVNVVLFPLLMLLTELASRAGQRELTFLLARIFELNKLMLIFNLLPIYPLDGGQILRSLLWMSIGRARSLQIATLIAFPALVAVAVWAYRTRTVDTGWIIVMGLFLAVECWAGLRQSHLLMALEKLPKHPGYACPSCQHQPPGGPNYLCANCGNRFDPFSTRAICPHCQTPRAVIPCVHCGTESPIETWERPSTPPRAGGPIVETS